MSNVAEKIRSKEAYLEEAMILSAEGSAFVVQAGSRVVTAKRATGCLVEPEAADRVLLAWMGDERFILTVLAREGKTASRLSVEGDLELRVPGGRFSVASQDGIDLTTPAETSLTSGVLNINAVQSNVVVQKLRMLGALVSGEFEKLSLVAGRVDSVIDRLHQKAKRSYRFIEEFDQVRAAHLDYRAKQTARMHGENTVVTAEELVKLDGKQVHIG